ncbi:hypothetical protein GCM10028808_75260 [Spirosoma migulaei]
MTTDEKITELLSRIYSFPYDKVINLENYRVWCHCDKKEFKEITYYLEQEGYIKSADGYNDQWVYITEKGKTTGKNNLYISIKEDQNKQDRILEEQKKRELAKELEEKRGKRLDRKITFISVIGTLMISTGTLIIGIWSTWLNQDMKDVKISMDSIRVDMKRISDSINLMRIDMNVIKKNNEVLKKNKRQK